MSEEMIVARAIESARHDYEPADDWEPSDRDLRIARAALSAYNPNERLREALEAMVYEATHLSAAEDDGSHWAKISAESLARARSALSPLPQGED